MHWLPDFTSKTGFQKIVFGALMLSCLLSIIFAFTLHNTGLWLSPYWRWVLSGLIVWPIIVLLLEASYAYYYRDWNKFFERPTDYRLILSIFWFVCFFSTMLFQYEWLYSESSNASASGGFWRARAEFFTVFLTFLAIIGFAYALYAKKVADSVFSKTVIIHKTMAQFFGDFGAVTDESSERSALGLIKYARHGLILYLGPPLIGYFRKRQFGSLFDLALKEKLISVSNPLPNGFSIKMLCWGEQKCHEYIEASNKSFADAQSTGTGRRKEPINEETFKGLRDRLFEEIRNLSSDGRGTGQIDFYRPGYDPPIRFVIADGRKAILWILENPTAEGAAEERKQERYAAAGFATDEPHMIRILEGLYLNATKDVPKEDDLERPASQLNGAE